MTLVRMFWWPGCLKIILNKHSIEILSRELLMNLIDELIVIVLTLDLQYVSNIVAEYSFAWVACLYLRMSH